MESSIQNKRTAEWLSLLLVIILSGLVVIFIGQQIIAFKDFPFDYDEANHANGALALFLELHAGDWNGFVREFFSQGFYPPGFSWMKAAAYWVFGPTRLTGRFFSLGSLFLACLVIYFLAREIDKSLGWLAGLIAVALTLTIRPLLVNAAKVMMEAPGLLATITFLWLYVRALQRPSSTRLLLTSLFLALTFFTKFTYGVIAVGTVGLMEISLLLSARRSAAGQSPNARHLARRWLWLLGPFVLILIIWFAMPGNLSAFAAYATAQPPDQPWITAENLFFYPRSIALHQSPSAVFALFTLASLVWSAAQWRQPSLRLLLIYFLTGMAIMTVNLPKNPRFIATIVPAAHLLTGLFVSWLAARWHADSLRIRRTARAGLGLFALALLLSIPTLSARFAIYPSLLHVEYETDPRTRQIMAWIRETIPAGEQFHIINYWDQLSPQLLAWNIATNRYEGQSDLHFAAAEMPANLIGAATDENIAALRHEILAGDTNYLVLFEGGPWGLPFWPEYTEATADILQPIAREEFKIELIDTGNWQDENRLLRDRWEAIKRDSRETLDISVIIFQINRPQQ